MVKSLLGWVLALCLLLSVPMLMALDVSSNGYSDYTANLQLMLDNSIANVDKPIAVLEVTAACSISTSTSTSDSNVNATNIRDGNGNVDLTARGCGDVTLYLWNPESKRHTEHYKQEETSVALIRIGIGVTSVT